MRMARGLGKLGFGVLELYVLGFALWSHVDSD